MSANPCLSGECQYSKDVAMPEYRCAGKCQYSNAGSNHDGGQKGGCMMSHKRAIKSVVDSWFSSMFSGDNYDLSWGEDMVDDISKAVSKEHMADRPYVMGFNAGWEEANGGENTRADTAELLFDGLQKDYQKVVAAFDEQRTLARNLRKSLIGYMTAVGTMNAAMRDGVNVHGAISDLTAWGDLATAVIAESEDLS